MHLIWRFTLALDRNPFSDLLNGMVVIVKMIGYGMEIYE